MGLSEAVTGSGIMYLPLSVTDLLKACQKEIMRGVIL